MCDIMQNSHISSQSVDLFLKLSNNMLVDVDLPSFLQSTLTEVGNALHVHRVYVFSLNNTRWENTFSWVDPRLPPFEDLLEDEEEGMTLQDALYEDGMFTSFSVGKPYVLKSVETFENPSARATLERAYIESMIIVPLFSEGELSAFLGVDQCSGLEEYGIIDNWAENTVSSMVTLGHLLNNAIHYFSSLQQLKKIEEETQGLFDMLPFPMYVTDPKTYEILSYNASLSEYIDTTDILHKKCYERIIGTNEPCFFCKTEHLVPGSAPYEYDLLGIKDNLDFKVIDTCIPWGDLDAARFTIALDITDSLRLQREEVLDRESTQAKSRFLANMSHELRTPLNGIIGMTNLAMQYNDDAKVGDYLEKVKVSSKNLLETINDILDFSKLEAGKLELEQRSFSPREVFQDIEKSLQEEAQLKGLNISYAVSGNVSAYLVGDAFRFSQIVDNLVRNSIKFSEQGSVSVALSVQSRDAKASIEELCLVVQDTGIGMTEETLKDLFTKFSQADTSSTRRYGGTGLGLSIVSSLLTLMCGRIEVQSTEGQGTICTCYIPFKTSEQVEAPLGNLEDLLNVNVEGTNILLAEDDEINTIIACEILKQMGCHVDCAQDGYEVLRKLKEAQYDLVLMDVQMPHMDGIEASQCIRQNTSFDSLPIVALTAHILTEEIDKCYAAGMQWHLQKPISGKSLYQAVAKYGKGNFLYAR